MRDLKLKQENENAEEEENKKEASKKTSELFLEVTPKERHRISRAAVTLIAELQESESVCLEDMPMPPSVNNIYVSIGKRRFCSREMQKYKKDMVEWRLENLSAAKAAAKIADVGGSPIRVDRYFAFHHNRIFTADGSVKKLDASNRVKAFDDALAEHVLGCDDKFIFTGVAEKVICPDDWKEHVVAVVARAVPRFVGEVNDG